MQCRPHEKKSPFLKTGFTCGEAKVKILNELRKVTVLHTAALLLTHMLNFSHDIVPLKFKCLLKFHDRFNLRFVKKQMFTVLCLQVLGISTVGSVSEFAKSKIRIRINFFRICNTGIKSKLTKESDTVGHPPWIPPHLPLPAVPKVLNKC